MRVALGEFLPDQSSLGGGLSEATNVYPRENGYGPVQAFASGSATLPANFRGGASFIAYDGTSYLLVGTAAGLVRYSSGNWTNLVTGLTLTDDWRFAQFGNVAIGVNGNVTKAVDLSAGTASTLAGAPVGKSICVVGDYVVIGQGTANLVNIYTSGFNNYADWNPAGTGGSTIQPMLTGGEVMGLAGGEYGVVLQRQRLVRMTRTGDATAPFQYDEITPNVGCASKASVVAVGRTVFFLSDRGFMALEDGQQIKPIGSEKVDRTFQAMVARDDYERLFAAVDPQNKLVLWCVPGSPGTLWIYNFALDRWATASLVIDGIFAGFTSSITLEAYSALYANLDTAPYSLDDPRFAGGNPRLYVVSGQQVGTLSGATLQASFGLSFMEPKQGRRSRIHEVQAIGDMTTASLSLDCRERLGDAPNLKTAGAVRASGAMPIRGSGRYIKPRLVIPAGALWSYAQALDFKLESAGGR